MTRGKRLGTAFTIALCGFACGAGSKPSSPRPPGAPSVALSTLTVSPATVVADGVALARIDVEVRDSAGSPVPGVTVVLEGTGADDALTQPPPTDAGGLASGTLASTRAEPKTITAWIEGLPIPNPATVAFVAGPPSPDQSTIQATPDVLFADGASQAVITVVLRDAYANPVSEASVTLAAPGSTVAEPAGPSGEDGSAVGEISATSPGVCTVMATVGATSVASTVVTFEAVPDPAHSSVAIVPPVLPADGATEATIAVTLRDASGAPIAGVPVAVASSGPGTSVQPGTVTTAADGTASLQITGSVTGTYALATTITIGGRTVVVGTPSVQVVSDGGPGPFVVRVARTGGGRLEGTGIACGTTCETTVARGTAVTLVASPDSISAFSGWSGACRGTGPCVAYAWDNLAIGAAFSECPGALAWADGLGGPGDDRATAVAAAPDGTFAVAGQFRDTASFGGFALESAGGDDIFVAKLSAAGTPLWAVRLGGPWQDGARAAAVDATGDVYVAGSFTGTATFGSFTRTAAWARDAFVARLSGTDGSVGWITTFGGAGQDEARSVAVVGDTVAVTGSFQGTVAVGANPLASAGYSDAFVATLARADGSVTWAASGGGAGYDEGRAVAIDPASGDVLATGIFDGAATFGGAAITGDHSGSFGGFLVRWPAGGGSPLWARAFASSCSTDVRGLAVGDASDAFVGATSCFIEDLGGEYQGGWSQPFVSRWAADGSLAWTKPIGDWGNDALHGLARAADGTLLAVGSFGGDTHIGQTLLRAADGTATVVATDAWFARLSPAGDVVLAQRIGGAGRDDAFSVAASADLAVLAGTFRGDVPACAGTLHAAGGSDALVAAFVATATAPRPGPTWPPPAASTPPAALPLCAAPPPPARRGPAAGAPTYSESLIPGLVLTQGFSSAVGDFDGDGAEDAIILDFPVNATGTTNVWALRPNGTGSFSVVALSRELGMEIDVGLDAFPLDADGDGRTDLFLVQSGWDAFPWTAALNLLWMQQADGTLRDETLARLPIVPLASYSAAVGDIDCDGHPDLYFPNFLLVNDGAGHFRDASDRLPGQLTATAESFCDLDRDGAPELILGASGGGVPTMVLHNDGFGRFSVSTAPLPPQVYSPGQVQAIACLDYDGDGWNDLAILEASLGATPGTTISLWHNRGDGTFEDRTVDLPQTDQGAHWLFTADLNGDGWPDLVVSDCNLPSRTSDNQIFLNKGGTFLERLDLLPTSSNWSHLLPIHAGAPRGTDLLRIQTWQESSVLHATVN
jgi:hypothetical protein